MPLPTDRLKRAGATDAEIAHLEAEPHEGFAKRLEGILEQDIRDLLAKLREAGVFGEQQAEKAVEVDLTETPEPEATGDAPEVEATPGAAEETEAKPKPGRKTKPAEEPQASTELTEATE